jgi:Chalcone isomerase-like
MSNLLKSILLAASVGLSSAGAIAAVVEVQGVKLEDSVDLKGNKLQLNGAGTRFKGPFKVYVAGLYVGKKASSLDEVADQAGPKRVSITMLREIDAGELGKLLTRGIEDNTPKGEFSKLVPGLIKMGQVFGEQKKLVPGDNFTFDWVPGVGSVLTVKGKPQGEPFKEPEFFKAILSLWLGPVPADWKLKDAMLGVK